MIKKIPFWLWATLIYTIITIIVTWPIALHLRTNIYSIYGDSLGTLWGIWWTKFALFNLHQSPFHIQYLAAPFWSQTSHPELNNFLILPLTALRGEVFSYNFLNLAGFVLAGLGGYFLVNHLTKNFLASLIAGVIYSFSAFHFARALGHWDLAQIQWLPFFFLFLIRFDEKRKISDLLLTIIFAALVFIVSPYHGIFLPIAILLYFLIRLILNPSKTNWLTLGVIFIFLVIAWFIYQFYFGNLLNLSIRPIDELKNWGLKPLHYIIPSPANPFSGQWFQEIFNRDMGISNITERTAFVGWIALFFALIGIFTAKKKTIFWILLGLFAFLTTLGPYPLGILLYKIAPFIRSINRFSVFVQLAIAVLAGYGLAWLLPKIKKAFLLAGFVGVIIILILAENYNATAKKIIIADQAPPAITWLKNNVNNDEIVLQIPLENKVGNQSPETLYFQRFHQRKLFNDVFRKNSVIPEEDKIFWDDLNKNPLLFTESTTIDRLKNYGVKYIIVFPAVSADEAPREVPDLSRNDDLELVRKFAREQNIFNDLRDNWQEAEVYKVK